MRTNTELKTIYIYFLRSSAPIIFLIKINYKYFYLQIKKPKPKWSKNGVMIYMKLYMKPRKKIYSRVLTVSWIPNDAGINYQDCCKKNFYQLGYLIRVFFSLVLVNRFNVKRKRNKQLILSYISSYIECNLCLIFQIFI